MRWAHFGANTVVVSGFDREATTNVAWQLTQLHLPRAQRVAILVSKGCPHGVDSYVVAGSIF